MDSAEQIELVFDLMLRIAPVVARRSLEDLFRPPVAMTATEEEFRREAQTVLGVKP